MAHRIMSGKVTSQSATSKLKGLTISKVMIWWDEKEIRRVNEKIQEKDKNDWSQRVWAKTNPQVKNFLRQ